MMTKCSEVKRSECIIGVCAIYIPIMIMIHDDIATNLAHMKFSVPFVPKRLGSAHVVTKIVSIL